MTILSFFISTWYFWVVALLIVIYRLFRPAIKGIIGEKSVSFYLSRLDKSKYRVINNIMLDKGSGTTQIDHVVVSNYGIFVIETKNYKGWILGGERDDNWTQVIYRHKERIHNPIKQNYGHVLALKRTLVNCPDTKFFPIVAVSPVAELKVKTETSVVYFHRILGEIKKQTDECLSIKMRDEIYETLQGLNIDSADNRKAHVKAIKMELDNRADALMAGKCPKCGSALVKRNGKYGSFMGCSNFPKCRFLQQNY